MMDLILGVIELGLIVDIAKDNVLEKKKKVETLIEEMNKIGSKNED
ncbi:MAG: hypothetical protein MSA15_03340 [Clostridium sp.]|nr:hypothetical protein [Clostridium sp.]